MKFKLLNPKVETQVNKLAEKSIKVPDMTDLEIQELKEIITATFAMAKNELSQLGNALADVTKVVEGEIIKRGITDKVQKQISIFDIVPAIEGKNNG